MNDELQTQLAEVLVSITNTMTTASDFAVAELPDIAQQYIHFGMAWHTAAFLISAIGACIAGTLALRGYHKAHREVGFGIQLVILVAAFATFAAAASAKSMLLVWFAPKVYLLQGIAGLLT